MADTQSSSATPAQNPAQARPHRGRGGRGRRGGTRGGSQRSHNTQNVHQVQNAGGSSRAFGGQLTRPSPGASLDAQAQTFIPASIPPITSSSPSKPKASAPQQSTPAPHPQSRPRQRRPSRSTAADIATRTHEDIANNVYECAICTNEIARNSKVWSCRTCWTVFHIGCIKKWSKNEGSAVRNQRNQEDGSDDIVGRQWRCPGCNLPKDTQPSAYTCWCEKELDPKIISGLPPHSCGQTCGRDRTFPRRCPHPCDLICHAGPCPPCTAMGPKQSCFCGKEIATRRCIDTEYEAGWSCGAICGDFMPCGEHTCPRPCHEGLCGACEVKVDAKCYCGKSEQQMMCSEKDEERESYAWTGCFDCRQVCNKAMDCGIHSCEKLCHPQDEQVPHCPRSPDVVTHCPCGKTALSSLKADQRTACTDPIPSCDKACGRTLPCGHTCPKECHTGECPPCLLKIPITCRCGRQKFETTCYGGSSELPQCFRHCKATLNCGRHECGERCCSGERKAIERSATKRKLKPLGVATRIVDEGYEAEHICTRICGRPLKCGNHTCQELCHKGPCGTCREAIFEDIACNCGRTVLQAPLPCGTRPPPCTYPCRRAKTCGHPQVAHNCHTDEEECPKCPFLTEKQCLCGEKTLKNQPCWRSDVLCGLICDKLLKCGSHRCQRTCHRPGECEDATVHCQQECGKPKKSCGHPCEQPCHAPSVCKEEKSCPFKVMITCDCQRKKEEVKCNARAGVSDPPGRQNSLKCDEECARLERNRKLATALHIGDDHANDHVPYSNETLDLYLKDIAWAHKQEEELRVFAADDNERRYRFPPMRSRQRAFLRSIAIDFGFDGESLDPEPHRHVVLFKTPRFVAAPMKTLAQAARIRRGQVNIGTPVVNEQKEEKRADEADASSWNGLLLRNPRFALTEDELQPELIKAAPNIDFDIHFLSNSDTVALVPRRSPEDQSQKTQQLTSVLPAISQAIIKSQLAFSVVLAELSFPPISSAPSSGTSTPTRLHATEPRLLRQSDFFPSSPGRTAGGWSQVAARRGPLPKAPVVETIGQKPIYTVLGSRLAEAKRRKQEEAELARKRKELEGEAVDDWSAEVEDEHDHEHEHDHGHEDENEYEIEHEHEHAHGNDTIGDNGDTTDHIDFADSQEVGNQI